MLRVIKPTVVIIVFILYYFSPFDSVLRPLLNIHTRVFSVKGLQVSLLVSISASGYSTKEVAAIDYPAT